MEMYMNQAEFLKMLNTIVDIILYILIANNLKSRRL